MSDDKQSPFEQAAAFQKIWVESISKLAQTAFSATPESVPPEILKQMRTGVFEALAKSWEEFMRSPQFLEAVKQMMDNAIAFKKLTSELLTKAHHEMQGTARTDIDSILLSVRHLETQVADRMDKLGAQVDEVRRRLEQLEKGRRLARPGAAGTASSARPSKERRRRSKPVGKRRRRPQPASRNHLGSTRALAFQIGASPVSDVAGHQALKLPTFCLPRGRKATRARRPVNYALAGFVMTET
jgi:hypothetical protein